jgi:hypothetical protein
MKTCYICSKSATSKEHVPAKCFFPNDSMFRKQLITVPSCTKHNEDTSVDDEYVRNAICVFVLNNTVAFHQFLNKVVKSISLNKNTAGALKKIKTKKGVVPGITIDRDRIDKIISKISRALYFKEFNKPWEKELIILTRHLLFEDLSTDSYALIIDIAEKNLPSIKEDGKNPKIFKYNVYQDNEDEQNAIIRMVFYEGFTFWVVAKVNS